MNVSATIVQSQSILNFLLVVSQYVAPFLFPGTLLVAFLFWMGNHLICGPSGDSRTVSYARRESSVKTGRLLIRIGWKLLDLVAVLIVLTIVSFVITYCTRSSHTN